LLLREINTQQNLRTEPRLPPQIVVKKNVHCVIFRFFKQFFNKVRKNNITNQKNKKILNSEKISTVQMHSAKNVSRYMIEKNV